MTIYWHIIHKELVILSAYQFEDSEQIIVEAKYSMLGYNTHPKYLVQVQGTMLDKLKVMYGT